MLFLKLPLPTICIMIFLQTVKGHDEIYFIGIIKLIKFVNRAVVMIWMNIPSWSMRLLDVENTREQTPLPRKK